MKNLAKVTSAACLALTACAAQAQIAVIEFSLSSAEGGPVTGHGTLSTLASSLAPWSTTTGADSLRTFYMWLEGIPESFGPPTTSFGINSLNDPTWLLSIDGEGQVFDLNFFARGGGTNPDGYSLDGYSTRSFYFCDGPAGEGSCLNGGDAVIDILNIAVTAVGIVPTIPEPHAVLMLLAGIGIVRWKVGASSGRAPAGDELSRRAPPPRGPGSGGGARPRAWQTIRSSACG